MPRVTAVEVTLRAVGGRVGATEGSAHAVEKQLAKVTGYPNPAYHVPPLHIPKGDWLP